MEIPIRELKAHLSEYLSRVEAGEALAITRHRKVIARITGVVEAGGPGLEALLATGGAAWKGGKPVGASVKLSPGGREVADLLLEDRA